MSKDKKETSSSPFAALESLRSQLPPGRAPQKPQPKEPARAVVRMERKGRGGKEVTVVEQLELSPAALDEWLKAAKQALGCGGVVEDGALVLQGDQRQRVEAWLQARGVRRISVG